MKFQRTRGFANGDGFEPGALDQNVFRGERNFRVGAAHDAADANGARAVAIVNDGQRGIEGALEAVESANFFAGFCATDADAMIADLVVVVRVQRMAELEHDVVGDVDDVADAGDAAGFETILAAMSAMAEFLRRESRGR